MLGVEPELSIEGFVPVGERYTRLPISFTQNTERGLRAENHDRRTNGPFPSFVINRIGEYPSFAGESFGGLIQPRSICPDRNFSKCRNVDVREMTLAKPPFKLRQ